MENVEKWKPLKGHENYLISSFGRCVSKERVILMKNGMIYHRKRQLLLPHDNGNGYLAYLIDGKHRYIHRLVAQAFIPNPDNKEQVDHIDGNKSNNHLDNLRWTTRSENLRNPVTYPHMSEVQEKKEIVILDADGKIIHEGIGIHATCKEFGLSASSVKACLNKKRNNISFKGFQFIFKEDYYPTNDYMLYARHNFGYDFVLNQLIVVVFSNGVLFDVFPSASICGSHFNICRESINQICRSHVCHSDILKTRLPMQCEMYVYKDLDDKTKNIVRRFYRNKYPIPTLKRR